MRLGAFVLAVAIPALAFGAPAIHHSHYLFVWA